MYAIFLRNRLPASFNYSRIREDRALLCGKQHLAAQKATRCKKIADTPGHQSLNQSVVIRYLANSLYMLLPVCRCRRLIQWVEVPPKELPVCL